MLLLERHDRPRCRESPWTRKELQGICHLCLGWYTARAVQSLLEHTEQSKVLLGDRATATMLVCGPSQSHEIRRLALITIGRGREPLRRRNLQLGPPTLRSPGFLGAEKKHLPLCSPGARACLVPCSPASSVQGVLPNRWKQASFFLFLFQSRKPCYSHCNWNAALSPWGPRSSTSRTQRRVRHWKTMRGCSPLP